MALVSYWIESTKKGVPKKLENDLTALSLQNYAMCSIELDEENNRARLTTSNVQLIEALKKNKDYKVTKAIFD